MQRVSTDLPAPLFTAEPGDLPRRQIQVHLVERLDRTEMLVDAPQLQQRLAPGRCSPLTPAPGSEDGAGTGCFRHGRRSRSGLRAATARRP